MDYLRSNQYCIFYNHEGGDQNAIFVESVLRYGLPVNFRAAVLIPAKPRKLRERLNKIYSELDSANFSNTANGRSCLESWTYLLAASTHDGGIGGCRQLIEKEVNELSQEPPGIFRSASVEVCWQLVNLYRIFPFFLHFFYLPFACTVQVPIQELPVRDTYCGITCYQGIRWCLEGGIKMHLTYN
ncbi:Oidioi.mRNA.OKI2018_I69.PAR.g8456.t1.cds [Oikopleura dioica]|uniref:V-type proton ATPase subunit C n=1 Tax=Oikopleura dioica TaxID=34765 RepID=A0ABN7RKG3_OIKDI|nr:Oidioi.mRNA.OKI2018_I69.PAR.g8456.t1.cds [Oikopleura dioica]